MRRNWKKLRDNINNFREHFIKWNVPLILVYGLLVVGILYLYLFMFRLDNDFWFLINTGKYIVNNGIPTVEPFTIHSGFDFMAQQWLTDVVFYLIYNKFNVYGMFVFVGIINLVSVILMYKLSMLVSNNRIKLSFDITFLIGSLLCSFFVTTRPQVFDILFVLLELYLLELYIKNNNKLYLIGLSIISFLMINFHASIWLILFVILIPYFIEGLIKFKKFECDNYNVIYLGIITLIMVVCGLINPYGVDSFKYLFNSYGIDAINNFIGEMKSVTVTTSYGLIIYMIIFLVFFSYYYSKGKKIKLRYLLLFLGTCYLGLSHFKGVLFLLVVSILSLGYNFSGEFKDKVSSCLFYKNKYMNIFIICLVSLFVLGYGIVVYNYDLEDKNKNELYDIVNYLDGVSDKNIKLYTGYDDGGYLQYRGYKTYIDPRAEVFLKANNKKEDIMVEYYNLQCGRINAYSFLDKYNFDYLIVGDDDILYNYIDNGYEVIHEDKDINYIIYKRIDDK